MKLTIPVNWAEDYFDKIDFSATEEIYGKLDVDVIGGGRPSLIMPKVNKKTVAEFVDEAHRRGLKFNYLMNGTCFDNLEMSKSGQKKLRKQLDWLSGIGVDAITVSLPMVHDIIKRNYPDLATSVSIQVGINCFEKARYWEDMGADKLNISYTDINKDFKEIRLIRKKVNCKIQTIANLICRNRCPHVTLHGNFNAHGSQCNHVMKNFVFDYYFFSCTEQLLSDPVEILKSAFIRPEDIHFYEEAGVDNMKLVERSMTTDALALIVKAYTERSYDGNMMDLVHGLSKYLIYNEGGYYRKAVKYLFQPSKVNVFKVKKLMDHLSMLRGDAEFNESFNLYIDNKKLDGFMDFFYRGHCSRDCDSCSYCDKAAEKAVHYLVPEEAHRKSIDALHDTRDIMVDGQIFGIS